MKEFIKKFRKILLLFLLVFAVFLVACNEEPDNPVDPDGGENNPQQPADPTEYTIEYDLDGGSCKGLVEKYESGQEIKLPIPKRTNYTFLGWYQDETLITVAKNADLKLKAKWINDAEFFRDNYFTYDGTEKVMELGVELPDFYQVEYQDNKNTNVGKYYSLAKLKDQEGNVVKTIKNIMVIDIVKNEEFEELMDQLLIDMFSGDQLSINFFFKDYSLYGLEHAEAKLARADMTGFAESLEENEEFINELKSFDVNTLSIEQKDCLEFALYLFENSNKYTEEMNYMTNGYLGSYLGYQANLPLELSEYKFYTEQDVIDFLGYLADAPDAFKSYYDFTVKQAEKGYGMINVAIDNVISQCEKFVEIKEENYLIDIFNDKVDLCDFLDDAKKEEYKAKAKELIQGPLTDAYAYIQENLPALKDKAIHQGGLAQFGDEGKELYEIMLQGELGYKDLTGDEAIEYIEEKLEFYYDKLNNYGERVNNLSTVDYRAFFNVYQGVKQYSNYKYEELLGYFQSVADKFVPSLNTQPEISINYVPKSLEENFSPACYFVSPLDVKNKESIYLNGKYTTDYNYVFTTMAHEGYPGHLYQYCYAKELDIHDVRKVIRNSGYTEGWATYMEFNALDFATNIYSKGEKLAVQYIEASDILNGLLSVRFDLAIHYEGMTLTELTMWMNDFFDDGTYTDADLVDSYNQLVEIPTNSVQYFYAHALILDMYDEAKEELGDSFNEVAFNKCLLDYGALPLEMVEAKVDEFIADQKILNGLN